MTDSYYLGFDLGSSYTKLVVIDDSAEERERIVLPTRTRRREHLERALGMISEKYTINKTCATGYGRNNVESDAKKTELVCASLGVSFSHPYPKGIIDIGGEDIKIISSGPSGQIENFYMNDKCSAGTGAFITEIAEKIELEIEEMSDLARRSKSGRVVNSFCTVFAKTEILGWKFDDVPLADMALGIYLSIVRRIAKLPVPHGIPIILCGGVIAYHPYLAKLFAEELHITVEVAPDPQYTVAKGAALQALQADVGDGSAVPLGRKALLQEDS